ncbi:hypothetical protein [Nostoc sp. JL33]|uniref:hypothetical protein n=1 Tax=Nostoc sp. JL33 TaxID=2815396 RepID=UPI0025D7403F|nr:hypothetical protein [Nostoc sp. JL33]MBN3869236.1 hypothetical protein [Nostoc sp. JL33]
MTPLATLRERQRRTTKGTPATPVALQCPIRNIPPSSQQIKFGYPASFWQQKRGFGVTIDIVSNFKEV